MLINLWCVTPMVIFLLIRTPLSTTTVQVNEETELWHNTVLIRDCSWAGDQDCLFNVFPSDRQTDIKTCWPFPVCFPLHLMAHDCTAGSYFQTKDGLQCPKSHRSALWWDPGVWQELLAPPNTAELFSHTVTQTDKSPAPKSQGTDRMKYWPIPWLLFTVF